MLSAWEDGIKESLGLSGGLHVVNKAAPRRKLKLANSDSRLLQHLRQKDGNIISTIRQLATDLDMPQSTLSTSLKRLVERGFIERNGTDIALAKRAV
ncbi:MAG: MarR family transcriptional regulator [Pseudomonadota bacterium]